MDFDRHLTLAQLAGDRWRRPGPEATGLYRALFRMRRVPARELAPEQLRLLITQHVALRFTVPLALERVEREPLLRSYLYDGDLLTSVLRVDHSFWEDHPELLTRVSAVLDRLKKLPYGTEEDSAGLIDAAEAFPG